VQKNHPTTGILTNGAKMLRDVSVGFEQTDSLTLYLRQPDFSTAAALSEAINRKYLGLATALDAATVKVRIPRQYRDTATVPQFIRTIEQIQFIPDAPAKIVFNERTGTIVIGANVRISAVAISHGNISINIKNIEAISQPLPFSRTGETARVQDQKTTVKEEKVPLFRVPSTTTVADLVRVMNALGITPRDMMIIFHALRESGALHAELESM
ncbi:MAG: flagellar biosynthesis protein FlgA, partial [Lentisphaerae bacterium]